MLLLLLSKNLPSATDNIPLIGAYYCLNMFMIATSTCSCTIVVHIYFRGNGKVPFYLRKIFLVFLANAFCMSTAAKNCSNYKSTPKNKKNLPANMITSLEYSKNNSNGRLTHHIHTTQRYSTFIIQKKNILPIQDKYNSMKFSYSIPMSFNKQNQDEQNHYHIHQKDDQLNKELSLSFTLIENDVREIRDYLRHTRNKYENVDSKAKQSNEWKQLALVLDRALFFIYLFSMIVSSTFLIL